ncbi:hypothetical protein N7520_011561 [Penicillium odoratum]|uniref:uncharacterized protein n=1 Tax=Penicillium odoratum TaxID=1167516 RepID=UPI00254901EE|nr:uncharacterized protein N7520_011561 [Penicillium odoratum]KAJ5746379.1 hypothetical protein N7520_011561 [Penicillium odoratum]
MKGVSDHDIALQLYLEEIAEFEEKQKGKQTQRNQTDHAFALECMKAELLTFQTADEDRNLVLSTLTAVTRDSDILASIVRDERIAARDHQYALALARGEEPRDLEPPAKRNEGTIALAMEDLTKRMRLKDQEDNGEGPSSFISSTKEIKGKCMSCLENRDDIKFSGKCHHKFCHDCTRQLILMTIKNESLYPARCCGQVLPPMVLLSVLSYRELQKYSDKGLEYSTHNRVYCADPKCSEFIPPFAIDGENGLCLKCYQHTHLPCRSLAHPGVECPTNSQYRQVLALADAKKWRECAKCKNMIELGLGCNHIICMYVNPPLCLR